MTGSRFFSSYESLLELHHVPDPINIVIWLMEKDNSEHKTVAYFSPQVQVWNAKTFSGLSDLLRIVCQDPKIHQE